VFDGGVCGRGSAPNVFISIDKGMNAPGKRVQTKKASLLTLSALPGRVLDHSRNMNPMGDVASRMDRES